jgi:hypothetical protein
MSIGGEFQNPPSTFASGGQKPFREKVSGLPKAFHWYGLDTLFFLCVPLCAFVAKIRRWIWELEKIIYLAPITQSH